MTRTLAQLIAALPQTEIIAVTGDLSIPVTAPVVETDSDLRAGGVFLARKGRSVDGHDFIPAMIARGAAAIIGERTAGELPAPYVQVRDGSAVLGLLSAAYHDFPSRRLVIIGVTGTDGKTTTTTLIHSILNIATKGKAGFISTIAADMGGQLADTGLHVTTPGAPQVQGFLAQMAGAGLTHVVLEMTSHGLAQGRLIGVDIDAAVLTNVTHEHLDFHGSWENYRAAKASMFRQLAQSQKKPTLPKRSILNRDDPSFDYFAAIESDEIFSYGIHAPADFRAEQIQFGAAGLKFAVGAEVVFSELVGEFNVYNILAAISLAHAFQIDWETIRQGIAAVRSISGRMQRIDEGQNFTAIVDFAHTPNALKRALEAARTMLAPGKRLIAVFGSAGLRDVEKRRLMAETSAKLADMSVLTAEDPRTESLDAILQMMAEGCISQGGTEGKSFIRVPDRGEAIYRACQMAQEGDIVIACGKGHEQSMCFGTIEYPWDDRDAMRAALRGTPLQTLPTVRSNA